MARLPISPLPAALLLCLAAGCGSEPADVVATYRTHVGQRIVEAGANGWGRVEERGRGDSELGGYTLTTPEGRNLVVTRRKEGWVVADAVDHMMWAQRDYPPPASPEPEGRFVESGPHQVGAWTGTGYRMSAGYCGSWTRFAVLREPGLETFGRMLRRSLLHGARERRAPACELQAIELMGQGVVLWVDDPEMTLEKIERRSIDPGRFRPPSRTLSRDELFRLLDSNLPKGGGNLPPTMSELPR
jgi:hypothetical protein